MAKHGRLDIVICTPSINVRKKILDYTNEELDRVLKVNISGNFNVLRTAGRIMVFNSRVCTGVGLQRWSAGRV